MNELMNGRNSVTAAYRGEAAFASSFSIDLPYHILYVSLRRTFIGIFIAGFDIPLPKLIRDRSSCTSIPSPRISQSNSSTIRAAVSRIWRLAKCLPGHCRGPPPYGIHDPSISFVEKVGVSLAAFTGSVKNLPTQNLSMGYSFLGPVFQVVASR
jgi:hypothetical protein